MSNKRSKNSRKKVARKKVQARREGLFESGPAVPAAPTFTADGRPLVTTGEENWPDEEDDAYELPSTGAATASGGGGMRAFRTTIKRSGRRGQDATWWRRERSLGQWALIFGTLGGLFWLARQVL